MILLIAFPTVAVLFLIAGVSLERHYWLSTRDLHRLRYVDGKFYRIISEDEYLDLKRGREAT